MTTAEPKMILVVEDDDEIRTMLRIALETAGFAVESAGDGSTRRCLTQDEAYKYNVANVR